MTDSLGIYIHIPFCIKKCAYCDFYSSFTEKGIVDNYLKALSNEIIKWGGLINRPIDTIYVGGGTPSVIGKEIKTLINCVRKNFNVTADAEITVEANPSGDLREFLVSAKNAGVNRLSLGVQSSRDNELSLLGRTHTSKEAAESFYLARDLGFNNISLDLMIGLPDSNKQSLLESLAFLTDLNPEHISAYILKIEKNTKFYHKKGLNLPSEEEQAKQYLYMCDYLEDKGYNHYEISNFSKSGFESRHNLKYWNGKEYIGIGPSAHSFLKGERFFYPRDLKAFIVSPKTQPDGKGGDKKEELMLKLRLKKGVDLRGFFGDNLPQGLKNFADSLSKNNLAISHNNNLSLTNKGMLVSNSIITEITEFFYENV